MSVSAQPTVYTFIKDGNMKVIRMALQPGAKIVEKAFRYTKINMEINHKQQLIIIIKKQYIRWW